MSQKKTSLQQLRQALDALRQDLETLESALIEFEEQALGEEGGEEGAQRLQSSSGQALNCSPFQRSARR